jgi:phospholipid/cholesterol/gamma-HCH transport system permease protein
LPRLIQEIGRDALWVTGAANLLIGVIIGFLGVSQLGVFAELSSVPGMVVVTHFLVIRTRDIGRKITRFVGDGAYASWQRVRGLRYLSALDDKPSFE